MKAEIENTNQVWIKQAADLFDKLIGQYGKHVVASRDEVYIQPYVDLSLHLIQMHLEGWIGVDFDTLAAVSGASAFFGYQPGEFRPKYAHLQLSPDQRIADATGFGYTWENFNDSDEAWMLLKGAIGAGHTAKGWDWENILFAGYEEAPKIEDRKIFAMADGPGTYARWMTWSEFGEWVQRVLIWRSGAFGLFTERVVAKPPKEIALRVMNDLVAWSDEVPGDIRERFKAATFGLKGIEEFACEVEDMQNFPDLVSCHGINPQWAPRRSTALYLDGVIESALFPDGVNTHLRAAALQYHGAFSTWQAFYTFLGHNVPDEVRNMPARRRAGAELVRCWAAHEDAAVTALKSALARL